GGFNGFYLQTADTGGDIDPALHTASHGLFVFGTTAGIALGDHVEVTGPVVEFFGMTEIAPSGGVSVDVTVLDEPAPAVKPAIITFPTTPEGRELFEGMLVAPQGPFTVSDVYPTNQFGEIILAAGETPLRIPTDIADPGSAAYDAAVADNAARRVVLDD